MGIRIAMFNIVYESVTMTPIDPSCCLTERKVLEYMEKNPPPGDDEEYSKELLLGDIKSEGFWCVDENISPEWEDYICEMVGELL